MTEPYWDRLIQGHLDEGLSPSEQDEFVALVRDSEAARQRFWELAEVHGLARDAARLAWPEGELEIVQPREKVRVLRFAIPMWLRPAGLVAAGLVLGVLMTGLAWAIATPSQRSLQWLLAEGFESGESPLPEGVPQNAQLWSGDVAEVVESQSGVQPARDRRMLRFLRSDFTGKPNPGGYISEVYRLLDVRDRRSDIAGDEAIVQVSALFNAAPFAQDERYHCSVAVYALDHDTATNGSTRQASSLVDQALAVTRRSNDLLDRDPATWQKVSTELRLPPNTDFLLLRISVGHGMPLKSSADRETFAAHYADDVRVILARRPLLP